MNAELPLLWHIPISHYSEKARWALDYKGIPHRRQTLGISFPLRTWLATGQGKLPILWLDGRAINDSTRIIDALDRRYPEPPLYPSAPAERKLALEIEEELDETLGPALRASLVTPMFRRDPGLALRHLTSHWPIYPALRALLPLFPAYYRLRHKIRDADLEADQATVMKALDRVDRLRDGRRYLVGDLFSVADLTAAALLAPVLQPPELEYPQRAEWPEYLSEFRSRFLAHPTARWALLMYQLHRGRSREEHRTVR